MEIKPSSAANQQPLVPEPAVWVTPSPSSATHTVLQKYENTIKDQINKGVIQPVQDLEDTQEGKVHYLSHHAVIRQDRETTKLRVVYDVSAKYQGAPSLKNCLYSGSNFKQCILDILQRFRTHKIAVTADVEKAFLMIFIPEKD